MLRKMIFSLAFVVQGAIVTHMTTMDLQQQCKDRIEQVFSKCEEFFGRKFNRPTVEFNLRGARAGLAYFAQNRIRLNSVLLNENGREFINDTPGHEAAHIIARHIYGNYPRHHGKEWREVMRLIGQEPSPYHHFKVKTKNEYVCGCPDQSHFISTNRHNKVLLGIIHLRCFKCHKNLVWKKLTA